MEMTSAPYVAMELVSVVLEVVSVVMELVSVAMELVSAVMLNRNSEPLQGASISFPHQPFSPHRYHMFVLRGGKTGGGRMPPLPP